MRGEEAHLAADSATDDQQAFPPLRPNWLHPVSLAAVIVVYAALTAGFGYWFTPDVIALGSIDAELIREGDFFDADAIAEADLRPDKNETSEQVAPDKDFALPLPEVTAPDSPPIPRKKEAVTQKQKKERARVTDRGEGRADLRSVGQVERRFGAPGGRGQGMGSSPATCLALVAASLRRHSPTHTSLGPGSAHIKFYVHLGGGLSTVSVSGTTPGHAALARQIVAGSRGPSNCGETFASQDFLFR
jgi:hypothetical protein